MPRAMFIFSKAQKPSCSLPNEAEDMRPYLIKKTLRCIVMKARERMGVGKKGGRGS